MGKTLLERLIAKHGKPVSNSTLGNLLFRRGVSDSDELQRILKIPRYTPDLDIDVTPYYRTETGTLKLWPIQSRAIRGLIFAKGLLAPIAVGSGKTLISLLAATALGLDDWETVLLVPPQLKYQLLKKDIPFYEKHFKLKKLHVVAYSELSSVSKANVLEKLAPKLIVADECHNLRHKPSARTKRFLRYCYSHPETMLVALSGTMTTRSIKDFAHLSAIALRQNSPLPLTYNDLEEWAAAIDVSQFPMPPGELKQLCNEGEHVRSGFHRRLVDTLGVVSTTEGSLGSSLVLRPLKCEIPTEVTAALTKLRKEWSIGNKEFGTEEFEDSVSFSRCCRQVALGFWYRWDWPGGVVDSEWLDARANWHRELRSILLYRSRPGLDSPLLVCRAAFAGEIRTDYYEAWARVKHRPQPPTVPVWIKKFIIAKIIEWTKRVDNGIVWFIDQAIGQELSEHMTTFGSDADASLAKTKESIIACSLKAHGTGKNLQNWSNNLLVGCPSNGATWEQFIARTHRPGQAADEVTVDFFQHTIELKEAFAKAREDANYIEATQGNKQKLNFATILSDETKI